MKCDLKIMGVPERLSFIEEVLKLQNLTMKDVFLGDLSHKDILETSIGALTLPEAKGITHRCIIQDDVIPAIGFKILLNKIVNKFPDNPFSLYVHNPELLTLPDGSVVEIGNSLMKGQAIIFPLKYRELLTENLDFWKSSYPDDDSYYGDMFKRLHIRVFTMTPCPIHLRETESLYGMSFSFRDIQFKDDVSDLDLIDNTDIRI